jgi:hypothetical protein
MVIGAGAHYVVPDFAWVQDCGGSLSPMADQVCRAIAWIYRNAASFGGDPDRLFVGGHSSGAHLAAAVHEAGKPVELIVGDNYSHMELPETLCNPYGLLGAAVLGQMGLTPP